MSKRTKCRNAKKKAANQRQWQIAQERKQKALPLIKLPESNPSFKMFKIDRNECSKKEDEMRKALMGATKPKHSSTKHSTITAKYEAKIRKLQPIRGMMPLFISESDKDLERIRIQQEVSSTEALKRKFAVPKQTVRNKRKKYLQIVADRILSVGTRK